MYKYLTIIFLSVLPYTHVAAFTYHNKTFLDPRPLTAQMPIETAMWHTHTSQDVGNVFGCTLQAPLFFHFSTNRSIIGTYFGVAKENDNTVIIKSSHSTTTPAADVTAELLLHNPTQNYVSPLNATLTLRPEQEAFGVQLGAFKDLSAVCPGLSVKALVPINHVRTNVRMQVEGTQTTVDTFSLPGYFDGTFQQQTTPSQLQDPLKFLKFGNREQKTGVGDVQLLLQYNFLEEDHYYIGLLAGLLVPTGHGSRSLVLFEPRTNNGGHLGICFGTDAAGIIWKTYYQEDNLTLSCELITRFLVSHMLSSGEKRVVGLLGQDRSSISWGPYLLGGKVGSAGVFPLANVLRQSVDVRKGNQLEAYVACAIHINSIILTVGGDFFGREGETVSIKAFQDDLYGIADPSYDTTQAFDANNVLTSQTLINSQMLDVRAAATPAQASGTLFASVHYQEEGPIPVFWGVGGAYEFSTNNSVLSNGIVWATFGVSF